MAKKMEKIEKVIANFHLTILTLLTPLQFLHFFSLRIMRFKLTIARQMSELQDMVIILRKMHNSEFFSQLRFCCGSDFFLAVVISYPTIDFFSQLPLYKSQF